MALPTDRLLSRDQLRSLTDDELRRSFSGDEQVRVWRERGFNSIADLNMSLAMAESNRRGLEPEMNPTHCVFVPGLRDDESLVCSWLAGAGYSYSVEDVEQLGFPGRIHKFLTIAPLQSAE